MQALAAVLYLATARAFRFTGVLVKKDVKNRSAVECSSTSTAWLPAPPVAGGVLTVIVPLAVTNPLSVAPRVATVVTTSLADPVRFSIAPA